MTQPIPTSGPDRSAPRAPSDALPPQARRSAWGLIVALGATAVLLAPTLGFALGYDHGILYYLGHTVVAGRWPYADSFDTYFPGAILLHAAVIASAGNSVFAFRVVDWLIQIATGGILYGTGRRLAGTAAGIYAACAYAALYITGGFYHTAQRDGFIVPLLLLALWGLWEYWAHAERRWVLWASGMSAGLACLFRPTYVAVVIIASVALVVWRPSSAVDGRSRSIAARVTDAAIFAGVAAVPLLLFVVVYVIAGRGRALADLLSVLATVYPLLERMTKLHVLAQFVTLARAAVWVGVALSVFSSAWRVRRVEMRSLAALLLGIVLVRVWESKGYPYQYWPAFACLALFAGVGWVWVGQRIASWLRLPERRAACVVAAVIVAALAGQMGRTGFVRYRHLAAGVRATRNDTGFRALIGDDPQQGALAHFLHDHTTPADSIQLWGAETMVLVAAERWSATRFMDPFYLFCDNGTGQKLATECGGSWPRPVQVRILREIVEHLTADPPRYVVAHYAGGTLAFTAGADTSPDLPELRALLDRLYAPEATFGNWTAYRRRSP